MSKPRVIHLVESLAVGGAEKFVCDMATERGASHTSVICLERIGSLGEALRAQGFRVDFVDSKGGRWRAVQRLRALFQRDRPQILHCHNFTAHLFGATAARLNGGPPVIMTKHGAMAPARSLAGKMNRWLAANTQLVGVSAEAVEIMKPLERREGKPILYIPNGISLRPYANPVSRREARARLGWPEDSFLSGIIARLTANKGHLRLLDVFSRLVQRFPSAKLVIVGDGETRQTIERRIAELHLESHVDVLGERHDIPLILAALDVFCLPSETEGMPITLLEAMAASRAVVASAVGAIPDVLEDGVSGILVDPFDSAAIEKALSFLAEHPERAAEMGEAGQRRVRRDYSADAALANYERLYERLVRP